jgi:hypothetical protein
MKRLLLFVLSLTFLAVPVVRADDENRPIKDGDEITVDGKTYKLRVVDPDEYYREVDAQRKAAEAFEKKKREEAAKLAKGPYDGFYRETKYGFGLPMTGIYFQTKRDEDNYHITVLRVTKSFWGYHNDRLILGNFSLSLVGPYHGAGKDPNFSLGVGIAPVGLRLIGNEKIRSSEDVSIYFMPTYTYLIGLNGNVAHRHAFGAELTFIW